MSRTFSRQIPRRPGNGTEDSQRFASAEKALEHGKDVALHVIAHIVRILQLDPETALKETKARTVKLSDYLKDTPTT